MKETNATTRKINRNLNPSNSLIPHQRRMRRRENENNDDYNKRTLAPSSCTTGKSVQTSVRVIVVYNTMRLYRSVLISQIHPPKQRTHH